MPNWCSTYIEIKNENKEGLKTFHDLLDEWTSKNYMDNGFGIIWLGNIVLGSGIGTIDKDKETDIECRGWLEYMQLDDNTLTLQTETAWSPKLKMWKLLCEKYLPNSEIIYSAEEPGMELFCTNDSDLIGKYHLVTNEWSEYDLTKEEVIKALQKELKTEETDLKKLLELPEEEIDNEDNYYYVHEWEQVAIEEWE